MAKVRHTYSPWILGDYICAPDGSVWIITELKGGKLRAERIQKAGRP